MLDFIYDSLDTVKKLKFPTVKQFAQLTGAIFGLVIVAWLYFILCDTIFSEGYKMFYSAMTNWEEIVAETDEDLLVDDDSIEDTDLVLGEDSLFKDAVTEAPEVEETALEEVEAAE